MATTSILKPEPVWWHSMSCVCAWFLERDRIASAGGQVPLSVQIVPSDRQDVS